MTVFVQPEPPTSALAPGAVERGEAFPGRKRFTRDDCDLMERVGILTDRYELVDGEIVVKMGQNPLHAAILVLLLDWLNSLFGGRFVRGQSPIEIVSEDQTFNRPEPDAAVMTRPITDFFHTTPRPKDVRLLVEVSDGTLSYDIGAKASLYARANIADYWVLDAQGRRLMVHRDPVEGVYRSVHPYRENDSIAPLASPEKAVRVGDLLPPPEENDPMPT